MKRLILPALALFVALIFVGLIACGDGNGLSSDDREKFIGNWAGSYGCESIGVEPVADIMTIAAGPGELDLIITLHADFLNPDVVTGNLTAPNVITVPEQTMGGAPGTAEITYSDDVLTLSQSGLGITCEGTDYAQVD